LNAYLTGQEKKRNVWEKAAKEWLRGGKFVGIFKGNSLIAP